MRIRKATIDDFSDVVALIDSEFTKEGFGFVNRAQIMTEISKNRVIVADDDGEICGVRIGVGTVWNIAVASSLRGKGIGKKLMEYIRPHTIRVKSDPIGHLSKKQKDDFVDPTGFYESLGFKFWGYSYPKNFWQKGKDGKGQFHVKGEKAHIKIYRDPNTVLFGLDQLKG
jgi:N-acetylglutamate synthase-like GNAT family acetyltransferase